MRKITLLSVLCVLLATVACSRVSEELDYVNGIGVSTINAKIGKADSRTSAVTNADGSIQMLWSAGDEIMVTDLSASAPFKLKSGSKTANGTFIGSIISKSKQMYAVYPANAATIDGATAKVTLPNIQVYTTNSDVDVNGRNIMIGESEDASEFGFSTVATIARFLITVGADEYISSVTMRVEDGYLSGLGTIDLEKRELGPLNKRNVTLNYAEPAKGVSNDGWALIAPLDFTALEGKVYYDIVTNKGKYTFCRKPTKTFKPGCIYNFPLSIETFEKVDSASALDNGKYMFTADAAAVSVRMVRATDTTISIAWSCNGFPADYSVDAADDYELYLYDERNQLLLAWQPNDDLCVTNNALFPYSASNPTCPPRWVFSGLTPNTTYKVKVKNITKSKTSDMLVVSTPPTDCSEIVGMAQQDGDVLVYQNFGKLVWKGDLTTQAAGYVAYDYSKVTDIAAATAWGDFRSASQTSYKYTKRDREQNLFTTYKLNSLLKSLGLEGWAYWRNSADDGTSATSSTVLSRPGYVKISATAVRAGIATPELIQLLGKATVRVSFKAAAYGTTGADDYRNVAVMALDNCVVNNNDAEYHHRRITSSTQLAKQSLEIENDLDWHTYTVELSGVTPTSRIVVCADAANVSSKNNRFHLDDIKVEFVKYDGDVNSNIPEVKQVAATPYAVTIEWNEMEQATRKYTVSLYKDSSCTDLYQSYTLTYATTGYVASWPTRFTFPYLDASRTYYATVTDLAGNVSRPLAVRTNDIPAPVANQVLYESFDNVCWGGDYMNMAASVKLNINSPATYKPGVLSEAISVSMTVTPTSDASQLTTYSSEVRTLFGMSDWTSSKAHSRPGYLKLGTTSAAGSITTPPILNLSSSASVVDVTFKACPFVDNVEKDQTSYVYVELLDGAGTVKTSKEVTIGGQRNIPGWQECKVQFASVAPGDKITIRSGAASQSRFCVDDILLTSTSAIVGDVVSGYVKDADGTPIANVAVSDGYTVVKTSGNGYYSFEPNDDAWYIYYSVPAEYEVPINSYGQPAFFTRYNKSQKRYDFTLTKLSGGAEKKFNLICLADPQCRNSTHRSRFNNESVPDVKSHTASLSTPSYGVTLGDVVYSEGNSNCVGQMSYMRDHMAKSNIGIPVFQTMGNHDYTYFKSGQAISADDTSSTYNIKAQREFEKVFGPIDYSWNRGDVHIVCMRNMQWNSNTDAANYTMMFTDDQYNWLKQDLACVPTTKMVIICVHIPFASYPNNKNVQNVISLLTKYKSAHIMSGHTHYMRNEPTKASGVYEHVHAAVCGTWWWSKINGDGCPNGYAVYEIDGTTMTNWYYKGVNAGMNSTDFQMRLYPGNLRCGGRYDYIQLQHGSGVLLANVFNGASDWTIKVYENDVYTGNMTKITAKNDSPAYGTSESSPCKPSTSSSQDWWAIGLHTGVVGRGNSAVGGNRSSYLTTCHHMYKYTIQNTSAKIRVEAVDRFGNVYSSSTLTKDYDYTYAKN
jgi:hypothetical protein